MTTQVTQNDVGSPKTSRRVRRVAKGLEEGDIVDGYVVKVDRDEVLLDIGYKSEGVIPSLSCPPSMTSTPMRPPASVTTSRPWSCRRRTRTADPGPG